MQGLLEHLDERESYYTYAPRSVFSLVSLGQRGLSRENESKTATAAEFKPQVKNEKRAKR